MKTVKIIIVALLALVLGSNSYAQMHDHSKMDMPKSKTDSKMDMAATKTETLNVSGNCDLCKARIEKAVKIDGVTKVDWNSKSKILSVTFDPLKINMDQISMKIARVGHDNSKVKANNIAYNALPGCCKYDRTK
jgi:mercuric ion binding protein